MSNWDESHINLVKQRRGNSLIVKRKLGEAVINKNALEETGSLNKSDFLYLSCHSLLWPTYCQSKRNSFFLQMMTGVLHAARVAVHLFQLGSLLTECA